MAIGAVGRAPGNQIDGVHLWSIANIGQYGRKILATAGMLDPDFDGAYNATVRDFWQRAAGAFRGGDGHLQAWDAGGSVTPYAAFVDEIAAELGRSRVQVQSMLQRARAGLRHELEEDDGRPA